MERIKLTQEQIDYLETYDLSLKSEKLLAIKNISAWSVQTYTLLDGKGTTICYTSVPFKKTFEDKMMMINAIQYGYELKEKEFVFYRDFYDHELKKVRKVYFNLENINDTTDVKFATRYTEMKAEYSTLKSSWNLKEIK